MKAICKFCKQPFPNYPAMKLHVELDHTSEFMKVSQWLGKTVEPKIETFERLAKEGMIGFKETPNGD